MISKEAKEYIEGLSQKGSMPGLERIKKALNAVGDPQNSIKAINVTGTNGKGSFCAMLSGILKENGYRVGVFSSPYLEQINESISIDGESIADSDLSELIIKYKPISEEFSLTEFEFLTLLCIVYFKENNVDIAVMEVGMGGRLDATNVFKNNLLTVITDISLDHTSYLGSSIKSIAFEKSGLIKEGCPVYFAGKNKEALDIIKEEAEKLSSPVFVNSYDRELFIISAKSNSSEFSYSGTHYRLPVGGEYQITNAIRVIYCVDILKRLGINIKDGTVQKGLDAVKRPARFEALCDDPIIIFDGGHNPDCITAFVKSAEYILKGEKADIITGVMADKDFNLMAELLAPIAETVYTVRPDNPRALDQNEYAKVFESLGTAAVPCKSFGDALDIQSKNESKKPVIFCVGSLYSYRDFKAAVEKKYKNG